jgi:PAS domain S-box-containing protein
MLSKLSIIHKGAILVVVPLMFQCLLLIALSDAAAESLRKLDAIERAQRGLFRLASSSIFAWRAMAPFAEMTEPSAKQVLDLCNQLENLFKSSDWVSSMSKTEYPELAEELDSTDAIKSGILKVVQHLRATAADPKIPPVSKIDQPARIGFLMSFSEYQQFVESVVRKETEIGVRHPQELLGTLDQTKSLLTLGLSASVLVTALLISLFSTNIADRLKQLDRNASAILLRNPLGPEMEGTDEFSQLDAELHSAANALALSREREFAVLERSKDVICALDSNLRFLSSSTATVSAWGYEESDVLARSLMTLIPPESKKSIRNRFESVARGSNHAGLECRIVCRDGNVKDFLWSVQWSEQRKTYFCVAHDITQRRAIERLRESFLSMVSHDLRAPVNSLSISVALLMCEKRGPIEQSIQDELAHVEEAADDLIRRMDALLEVAKSEMPEFKLSYRAMEPDKDS